MSLSKFDAYRIFCIVGSNSDNENMILSIAPDAVDTAASTFEALSDEEKLEKINIAEKTVKEVTDVLNRAKLDLLGSIGGEHAIH